MYKFKMAVYAMFYIHVCRVFRWHDEAKAHEAWLQEFLVQPKE